MEHLTALIEQYSPVLLSALWHIIVAVLAFFIGRRLINWLLARIEKMDQRSPIDVGLKKFLRSLIKVLLWALLIYLVAYFLGIPTATFVALLGSIGVTIGLALQGSLSNFAGGVLLLLLHPFRVGNYIRVSDEVQGTVNDIGLFYTRITTADNRCITIPNGALSNGNVTNYNACATRRVDTSVGISYTADADKAIALLTNMLKNREKVIRKDDCIVFIKNLGESSVDLELRCWVNSEDYWNELWAINRQIKAVLDENSIEIPYNQLDVHVVNQ